MEFSIILNKTFVKMWTFRQIWESFKRSLKCDLFLILILIDEYTLFYKCSSEITVLISRNSSVFDRTFFKDHKIF